MKNYKTVIAITIVVVALALIKIFYLKPDDGKNKGGKPNAAPIATTAYLVKPEKISQQVYVSGTIVPFNQVSLRSEIAGKIVSIAFKDGEYVQKGHLLVKINDADLQAQLLKNTSLVQLANQKKERLSKLKSIDGVSQEELDIVESDIKNLESDKAFLSTQIAKSSIIAPFSGTIGLKLISEGAYVSPNDVIASFVQTKPIYIDFALPEKYAGIVKRGMGISFQGESLVGGPALKAQISAMEPIIDPLTKTLKCRATYFGSEQLFAGAFVKVYLDLGTLDHAILIPTQSIIPILKGQKVFVAKNGLAEEVKVTTGIRTDEKIQILDGLQIGDTILTSGLLGLKKGAKLRITKVQ